MADDKELLRFNTVEFTWDDERTKSKTQFLDLLADNLRRNARDLGRTNRLILDSASLVASLAATISNIKTQQWAIFISLGSLSAAAVAVAIALQARPSP